MSSVLKFLLLPALAGGAAFAAGDPLTWETSSRHVAATARQQVVTVAFPFRNGSGRTVTLLALETSCRCLSATSSRMTYAAGERGRIEVALAIGGQRGALEKSVTVTTDARDTAPTELILRVDVPPTP